jgi:transcriptional regulator with XRE-family HTH domain
MLACMTLQALLKRHNILAPSELRRRIPGMSRAHASNLWRGQSGVGKETMRLLHDHLGIPYDELMDVDAVSSPAKPNRQSDA